MRVVRPFCLCGCGRRVKGRRNRWATPQCVPREQRAANCRAGRATFAYRCRMRRFAREVKQLEGRAITREDLLAVFDRIYEMGHTAARTSAYRARRGAVQERKAAA